MVRVDVGESKAPFFYEKRYARKKKKKSFEISTTNKYALFYNFAISA